MPSSDAFNRPKGSSSYNSNEGKKREKQVKKRFVVRSDKCQSTLDYGKVFCFGFW